jgi:hypothetical protein
MSTTQSSPFAHHFHGDNETITESHCLLCGVLIAGGTEDKYLAIAEAAHKCPMMETQHQA